MRPLELRVRNFRSFFGDDYVFDFRDRRLVGVVGPIGSGKSTILDAIAFALYGRTPRIARSTKSLIHQRADAAAVALRFEIDGQIWEAVRQIRAKGQSQHALYRYASDDDDAEQVEKVMMEGDVNRRIEELLGFDYDAFGRSVLLAQGQFAEFLNSRPAERDKVLKGVFGHERIDAMRELAKVKVKDADHEIEKLAIRLEQAEAAVGRLAGRRESLERTTLRLSGLEAVQPEFEELSDKIVEWETRSKQSNARLTELTHLAERLPDASLSEERIIAAERARARRAELASELAVTHEKATAAETKVKSDAFAERSTRFKQAAEMVVRLDSQRATASVADQQTNDATARVIGAKRALNQALEALTSSQTSVEASTATLGAKSQALEAAEQSLTDARHADMASALRHELEEGHTCPVCDQPVHEIPPAVDGVDVAEAETRAEAARSEREDAERTLRDAAAAHANAKAGNQSAETLVGESEKEEVAGAAAASAAAEVVTSALSYLATLVGEGDPSTRLEAERVALDQLGAEVEATRKAVEDIRRTLDEAIAAEQEADRALGDLRTQVVSLATQLDASTDLPQDDPSALREALAGLRAGWSSATAELAASIEADRAESVAASGRVAELREDQQIDGSLGELMASVRAEIKLDESEINKDEQLLAASSDLISERERLEDVAASFRRLATDLTDAKFIRFLLDEERASLAELGSDHFQRLSSGRYRFTEDGDFNVMDLTSADSVRKADSLSGGETFLASLSLALGLSEMVGRIGGRLDAFFLDEGFGTLDTEHLDLAMEGIEALVTEHSSRLVVVVSHVPELRHRIEDLIVLDKDPVTGDSVLVSGAVV